jgi:cell division protease FtsH
MARAMVTRFGMSDELGPIAYAENQEEVFLGHSVSRTQNVSEATAQKIDAEIRRIIDTCYNRANDILTAHVGRPAHLAQGPARIRDADGRRDHRAAQGHSAGAHAL